VPLATSEDGNMLTVHVEGALDSQLGKELREAAANALAAGKRRVLLSLQRAKQANSQGLEAMVATARAVASDGGRFALVGPSPLLADILKATRLERRFAVFDSTEQAIAALRREIGP
jgi:anti-sigma B factor antagonist